MSRRNWAALGFSRDSHMPTHGVHHEKVAAHRTPKGSSETALHRLLAMTRFKQLLAGVAAPEALPLSCESDIMLSLM